MLPHIENPKNFALPPEAKQVLKVMFTGYQRAVIRKEFDRSLSGGRVIEVRPIKADGTPELPTVAKLAAISLIQKEWQAYQQHIRHRLPNIAAVSAEPVLLPEVGWGGLRYTLVGSSGTFEVMSLRDYCRRGDVTANDLSTVLGRLVKIMHQMWGHHHVSPEFHLQSSYDRLLPVSLLVEHPPLSPSGPPYLVTPETLPLESLEPGALVRLAGFAVTKVDLVNQTVTLTGPKSPLKPAFYLRLKSKLVETLASYQVNQIIDPVEGEVIETRTGRLQDEIQRVLGQSFKPTDQMMFLPDGTGLPNPLPALSTVFTETRDVKVGAIHGDFNLENVLIEPETGMVSLIDFAEAREDHVLHDCLRLETEVMTKLFPEILYQNNLSLAPTLALFYWQLHCATFQTAPSRPMLPYAGLEKPWAILTMLRQTARKYLFDGDDVSEYYQGLTLYLLGALKFRNLDAPEHLLSKQVAFWGAALAYQFLTALPDTAATLSLDPDPPQAVKEILAKAMSQESMSGSQMPSTMVKSVTDIVSVPSQSGIGSQPATPEINISAPNLSAHKTGAAIGGESHITVGNISGGYVAIGREAQVTVSQSVSGDEIVRLFETIYRQIEARSDDVEVEKEELIEIVTKIQREIAKEQQANLSKIERWLNRLARIAPDLTRSTVIGLLQSGSIPPPIRQIAAQTRPAAE
jgi:hypothetical protein